MSKRMSPQDLVNMALLSSHQCPNAPIPPEGKEIMWLGQCKHGSFLGIDIPTSDRCGHVTSTMLDPLKFPFMVDCARYVYHKQFGVPYAEYPLDPELDQKLRDGRLRQEDIDRMNVTEEADV